MKKVLSFVLVLSMILGSFGMAFAAPADVVGKDYEDAVNVLVELGVVAGYKDGSFKPENIVTRAEMATFIVKAMGLADYAVEKSSFSDMAGHWADPFVAYAASLGFVKGNTDGTFAPDATVSYDQAITMVVQALGYKGEYLVGGYPGAFVNHAKALGLLDGVKSGVVGANRGDIATLLFNALDKQFVRYTTDGSAEPTVDGDCMRARLTGATGAARENYVVEGDEKALINMMDYQGAYVDYFVNKDGDKIVAIKAVKSVFLEGDINEDGTVLTLADETEYKLDRVTGTAVKYFENGIYTNTTKASVDVTDAAVKVAVELSGKYVDKIYSIAKWDADETVKWDANNVKDLEKDTPVLEGHKFVMTDNDEIDTKSFALVGAESLDKIAKDSIVTFYVADADEDVAGLEIVKVEVSTTVVEGKVTKVNKDGDITVNGKVYEIATGDKTTEELTIVAGEEGKFFLNAAGKVAAKDTTGEAADDYAIVVKAASEEAIGYDAEGTYKIKLLTADGKTTVYTMTDAAYAKVSAAAADFAADKLVAYTLNKDGEINDIVTKSAAGAGATMTKKGLLGGKQVAADVVVFTKDTDGDWAVADKSIIPVDEVLDATTYYYDSEDKEIKVIICENVDSESGVYGVVVDSSWGLDADDERVLYVDLLIDGELASYEVDAVAAGYAEPASFAGIVSLCAFDFEGDVLKAVEVGTEAAVAMVDGNVDEIKAGDFSFDDGETYYEIAADAVVYVEDEDGNMAVYTKDIEKDDFVELFKSDADLDAYDIIIVREALAI